MVHELWEALKTNISSNNQSLIQVAVWAVGEYGDYLFTGDNEFTNVRHVEAEVLEILNNLLLSSQTSIVSKEYVLISLMKLSTRFKYSTK